MEEQATSYFVALEAHEEAVQRAGEAEVQMARSVQALLELGETVERVAVQCELSEQEVRRLRKLATTGDGRQDEEDAPEASTVDVDEVKAAKPAAARVSVAAGEDSTALAVDVTRGEPALVS